MLMAGIRGSLFAKKRRHFYGGNLDYMADAFHFLRVRGIERFNASAKSRWSRDDRVEHSGQLRIDSVVRLANHDERTVHALIFRADDSVVVRILQRNIFRD